MTHPPSGACPHVDPEAVERIVFEGIDARSVAVFRELRRSIRLSRRLMSTVLSDENSHPAQAVCLSLLSHAGDLSQSDLARTLHVSKPTVTSMLQKLEAAGLIVRTDDEHDARLTRINLTEKGRETAERIRAVHTHSIDATIGCLPEDEREELARLLGKLNATYETALAAEGHGCAAHPGGCDPEADAR